jgi:integrative and conjugative element protein (TIGR02256 family)
MLIYSRRFEDLQGMLKAHALSQHILFHNPFVKTIPIPGDIMILGINQFFASGIGISTIANDNVEGYLNEQAIINKKTVFYARALRGGKVARIFRVQPGVDACFNCLSLYTNEENGIFTNIPEDSELPTITNECNNPIRPASAAELKLIASLTSKLILDYLQQHNEEHNHWIWSTEHIDGIDESKVAPYELKASTIPPHPSCQYCQSVEQLEATINLVELESMKIETRRNPNIETGGVLLGEIRNGTLQINFASDPGPKARMTHISFEKDIKYCQQYINEKYEQHGSLAAYIGEWHYHPSKDNLPSGTDLNSLAAIANHQGYLTENPVMIILSNEGHASCTIHPSSKTFYNTILRII